MLCNAYSILDYGGLFFTKHRDRLMENMFICQGDDCIFKDKMAIKREAIDKCGFWSSLLHVFYMYSCINGVDKNDVLCFILFFSHQCNTTIVIVTAMLDIMSQDTKRNQEQSFYSILASACEKYKTKNNSKDTGCAGGQYQRFSPSDNKLYDESEVFLELKNIDQYLSEATFDLKSIPTS